MPRNWVSAKIGDLFNVVGGGTPDTQKPEYWSGDFPWISSADIDERHRITPRRTISREGIENSATNLVPKGSVIIVTRVGLGKAALTDRDLCFSQDSQALLFDPLIFDPHFVLYQMSQTVRIFRHVSRGTTISGVTKKQLLELDFRLPPLAEQRRIVGEVENQFTRLDAAVAALKRVQANLKRYRASVLKAACEGRLVPTEAELARREGRSYEPASELLKGLLAKRRSRWEAAQMAKLDASGKLPEDDKWKSKYEEPYEPETSGVSKLTEGWSWATISQLGFVQSGQTPKGIEQAVQPEGEIPWFKVGDMNRLGNEKHMVSGVSYISANDATQLGLHIHPAGTIIFPKRGGAISTNKKRLLARMSGYDLNTMGIIPVTEEISGFLWWWFAGVDLGTLSDGSNVPQINHGDVEPLCLPLPPLAEQHRIVAEVERRLSIIEELELEVEAGLKRGQRLLQAILKRAFEGKLVPQDSSDEPASVLLERVRAERNHLEAERRKTIKAKREPRKKQIANA